MMFSHLSYARKGDADWVLWPACLPSCQRVQMTSTADTRTIVRSKMFDSVVLKELMEAYSPSKLSVEAGCKVWTEGFPEGE